jgi:DNA replication protein DnaC
MSGRDPQRDNRMVDLQNKLAMARQKIRVVPGETKPPAPINHCEACGGMGIVSYDVPISHPKFGKSMPCPNTNCTAGNERRRTGWDKRLLTARIPDAYKNFTFDTWLNLSMDKREGKNLAYAACGFFSETPGQWVGIADCYAECNRQWQYEDIRKNCIMLFGPVGTGKTGLCIAALNALLTQHKAVIYIRARDLITEVQKRYGKEDGEKAEDILEIFQQAPVLMIDEFNMHEPSDNKREIFETVMRYRYGNGLPTIMTANVDQQQFYGMWGERTADVVVAMAHWIPVAGPKLRETHAAFEAL